MKPPLISCIVPVYNCERYVREAVESIFAQTYRPLELIVADDGSTDHTPEVIGNYRERLIYLRQNNQGYAAAKNLGLSGAHGDFIAFLDADDLWHPEKLATQIAWMCEQPAVDLCFTVYENFWMPELADEERHYRRKQLSEPQTAWSISTLMARRTVFERFGNFQDGTRGLANMTWFLRAAARGAVIAVIPDILMHRRFNVESFTRDRVKLFENFIPILKEWRDYQQRQGTYKTRRDD